LIHVIILRWELRPFTPPPQKLPQRTPGNPSVYPRHPRPQTRPGAGGNHPPGSWRRMELSEESAAPSELTPRSRKRAAVKAAKAEAKRRDPVAFKALRAEQERNRIRNKKLREAANAATALTTADGATMPSLPPRAITAASTPLSAFACSTNVARLTGPAPPPFGDATFHLNLPYGLSPPPPSPIPPPSLPPMPPPPVGPLTPFNNLQQPDVRCMIKDGRTFEQKRIKELELRVRQLEDAVSTRDAELQGYADSVYDTVKAATEMRDADDHTLAGTAICGYMMAFPHKPEGPCDCVYCIGLSFLAPMLKHRAGCMARMRAEKDM
jgi:hypothetical protein